MEPARQRYSFLEYLGLEAISPVRHEFRDGQVWAMAGGSPEHAGIAVNIASLLRAQLAGRPCRVFSSDLRVRVLRSGLGTYPDVSVVCGRLETDPEDPKHHTITNPTIAVEVLSPSTEDYDRGEKLAEYKSIPSLQGIVLVAHDRQRLELWERGPDDGWTLQIADADQTVRVRPIDCALVVRDIYDDPLAE